MAPGLRRCSRVLRGQVRGAVRAGERAGAVHQVLRPLLRGVQLRADGDARQPRRVPLLPRHAHRRAPEEAQVPVKPRARPAGHRLRITLNGRLNLHRPSG